MDRAATGRHLRGRSAALRSDSRLVVLLMCEETTHHAVQIIVYVTTNLRVVVLDASLVRKDSIAHEMAVCATALAI